MDYKYRPLIVCLILWLLITLLVLGGLITISKVSFGLEPAVQNGHSLLLFRTYDSKTHILIGWLPMHNAVLFLELIDEKYPPSLKLNEAVDVRWLPGQGESSFEHDFAILRVAPARIGDCIPAGTYANVVLIKGRHYLVRKLWLGPSRWEKPIQEIR